MRILRSCIVIVAFTLVSSHVLAAGPIDAVRTSVEKVISMLRSETKEGVSPEQKRAEVVSVIREFFDFRELSRRTLGRSWKKLSIEQQKEFVELYRTILENTYVDRILEYNDEKVEFRGERKLSSRKALVSTVVVTATKEIPIDYRLVLKGERWRVYDVVIEGISLVKNYRTQFRQILSRKDPDGLLDVMRQKVKDEKR